MLDTDDTVNHYTNQIGCGKRESEVGMHTSSCEGFEPRSICITVHDFHSLSELESYAKELYAKLGGVIDPHN